jgi:1,2-diacylglycerol 3-alpha-glucosyltransferase
MPKSESGNILLIWNRIGDYHAARFNALEKEHGEGRVFIADLGGNDSLYKWKNPLQNHPSYFSLSDKPVETEDSAERLRRFKKIVRENKITCLGLAGYGQAEYRKMLLWCWMNGISVVLFAESWYPGKGILDLMKGSVLRQACRGFLVSGERAKAHFHQRLGIPTNRIQIPYSVVDNQHFLGVNPDYNAKKLLCVARFSPEKNLPNLVKAFKTSGIDKLGWTLELVGGGPQKKEIAADFQNDKSLIFKEWVSYEDLPQLYASASFFILPSLFEPWGLVVNEAMSAGLPVAVSNECGCAPDLVPDSSFHFPANDLQKLEDLLKTIAGMSPEKLRHLGESNRQLIQSFSPKTWAEAFLSLAGFSTV